MGKKRYGVKTSHGRKNRPRDSTKIKIAFYLYEKGKDSSASRYELIHHAGISSQDYPNMNTILDNIAYVCTNCSEYSFLKKCVKCNNSCGSLPTVARLCIVCNV